METERRSLFGGDDRLNQFLVFFSGEGLWSFDGVAHGPVDDQLRQDTEGSGDTE